MRRRRRPHRSARHGLQHIGDLLPKLMAELKERDVIEERKDDDSVGRERSSAPQSNGLVSVPAMAGDSQTMFAFYQSADV